MAPERRESYRCAVMSGKDQALLHVGRKRIRSQLLEESAGGFSLMVPNASICKPGDCLLLEASSGRYKVRVVHCTEEGGAGRIGLQRLAALTGTSDKLEQSRGLSSLRGKGLVGTAILLPILLALFGYFPGQTRSSAAIHSFSSTNGSLGPIHQFWKGVKGLDSLDDPAVADDLELTEDQRRNIDYVYYEASVMLGALHDEVGDESPRAWQQGSMQAIELAVQRVVNNMTDEQVEQWIKQLREPSPQDSSSPE